MESLLKALSGVKSEVGKLSKDATNKFFNSKYFDINQLLEQVEPLLQKHGLLLLQPIEAGKVKSIIYEVATGLNISSEIELIGLTDPQKVGSAITYYRRYTLQSLLGLQAEDDDANHASTKQTSKPSGTESQPTEWLNLFNKDGSETTKFLEIQAAIASGKKITLAETRKKYKVSKETASELLTHFKIQ